LHELRSRILLYKYWFVKLHKLHCRILFDNDWFLKLHELHCRILFDNDRFDFIMYFKLYSRDLFSGGSIRMHELRFRNIIKCRRFLLHIYNCMCIWAILINRLYQLHKLFHGHLSGLDRIHFVYGMHRGIILCYHGFDCSDGRLCNWKIFSCFINSLFKLFIGNIFIICICDQLFKLSLWDLSCFYRVNSLHTMHCRIILRHHGSDCSDGFLCSRFLLGRLGNRLFQLFSRNFPSDFKLFKLHIVYCWVILCHHGSDSSDGRLCNWNIFCCFINSLFKLFIGSIFIVGIFNQLFKLSCGILSSHCKLFKLHIMYCWIILCHHGSDCSDRRLCCRLLLDRFIDSLFKLSIGNIFISCIFNQLHKLSFGNLSGLFWIHGLYSVYRRIVLRHHGSHCCIGSLRSWKVFRRLGNNLFKLSFGNICIVRIFNQLFKLSCWDLPGFHRHDGLFSLRLRILLCHHWPLDCYRSMCGRKVLSFISDLMYELCRGKLPGLNGVYFMFVMPRGFVLRHHGAVCCDGRLCNWLVLSRLFNNLFELLIW